MVTRERRVWLAVIAVLLAVGWYPAISHRSAQADEPRTVRLVVDYGDGVEKHFTSLPWKADMTVLDLLRAAARHPRGIRFQHRGSGSTAFVTSIDGVKNEGGKGRNWVYRVDGKLGDRSCGAYRVKAGQKVLWAFATYP